MMKKILQSFAAFVLISFAFLLSTNPAKAIEYDYLGGRPANPDPKIENSISWFIYNLDKGQQKEDSLFVINNFSSQTDVVVYAADSVNSSNGGFALKQFVEPKTEVGSWIKFYPDDVPAAFNELYTQKKYSILEFCATDVTGNYSVTDIDAFKTWCKGIETVDVTIPAKKQKEIRFVFSVPKEVDVGEFRGGILIQKKEVSNVVDSTLQGVSLTTRVGIRLYETVPGLIVKKLEMSEFAVNKTYDEMDFSRLFMKGEKPEFHNISTHVANLGNVSVDFNETITISDELGGKEPVIITDRKFQALRQGTFVSNYDWEGPRFGRFGFVSSITYQDADNQTQTLSTEKITVWILPWREFIAVISILLIIFIVIKVRQFIYKKKYGGIGWAVYTIKPGDSLKSIERRFEVNWATFVKTNKIDPPYTLRAGQKVKVPRPKN